MLIKGDNTKGKIVYTIINNKLLKFVLYYLYKKREIDGALSPFFVFCLFAILIRIYLACNRKITCRSNGRNLFELISRG